MILFATLVADRASLARTIVADAKEDATYKMHLLTKEDCGMGRESDFTEIVRSTRSNPLPRPPAISMKIRCPNSANGNWCAILPGMLNKKNFSTCSYLAHAFPSQTLNPKPKTLNPKPQTQALSFKP